MNFCFRIFRNYTSQSFTPLVSFGVTRIIEWSGKSQVDIFDSLNCRKVAIDKTIGIEEKQKYIFKSDFIFQSRKPSKNSRKLKISNFFKIIIKYMYFL